MASGTDFQGPASRDFVMLMTLELAGAQGAADRPPPRQRGIQVGSSALKTGRERRLQRAAGAVCLGQGRESCQKEGLPKDPAFLSGTKGQPGAPSLSEEGSQGPASPP